jgi:hypothetical protein
MADGNQATTDKPSQGAEGTGFRPVTGGEEMQSGGRLLVEAYASIWIILMVLVVFMWRRTRALEARIAVLDAAVKRAEKAAARPGKKAARDGDGSTSRDEGTAEEGA